MLWASGFSRTYEGNRIETQTNGYKWRLVVNNDIKDSGTLIMIGKIVLEAKLNNGKKVKAIIIGYPFGYKENWYIDGVRIY